jgi:hypothetical protein
VKVAGFQRVRLPPGIWFAPPNGNRKSLFLNEEVTGVVEDVRVHGVDEAAPAIVYWPAMLNDPYTPKPAIQAPRFVTFAIRSDHAGTENFLQQVQQAVWSVNASLPLAAVNTMQEVYSQSLARTSFTLVMLATAGTMALALSLIGIYGVISYAVSQRTREIGIRLALGAQKGVLRWMFVRSALGLTGVGVVIGLGAAAALMRLMKSIRTAKHTVDGGREASLEIVRPVSASGSKLWV